MSTSSSSSASTFHPSIFFDPIVDNPERLTEAYRHDEWLKAYPLNTQTILDYFAFSPFYQRDCLNEVWRAQGIVDAQTASAHAAIHDAEGIEYSLRYPLPVVKTTATGSSSSSTDAFGQQQQQPLPSPPLFVIERKLRGKGGTLAVLNVYYCLHGTVFQAPDLKTLVASRVEKAAMAVARAARHCHAELSAPPSSEGGGGGAMGGSGGGGNTSSSSGDSARSFGELAFRASVDDALRLATASIESILG